MCDNKREMPTLDFENTLVAFFDIQGYSSFVSQEKKLVISQTKKLFDMSQMTAQTDFFGIKFHSFVLSDSLIIVIDTCKSPLNKGSIHLLLATCSAILSDAMFFCNLPLRGAIGAGWFYKCGDLITSSALVDAAVFERNQNWLGACITEKAERIFLESYDSTDEFKKHNDDYIGKGKIPWKNEVNSCIDIDREFFYIKPLISIHDDPNFKIPLPSWFNHDTLKVINSHDLYSKNKICK